MVTDTYAHGFDADRKLIAHEMDTGFFSKVNNTVSNETANGDILQQLKAILKSHPELLPELLQEKI